MVAHPDVGPPDWAWRKRIKRGAGVTRSVTSPGQRKRKRRAQKQARRRNR